MTVRIRRLTILILVDAVAIAFSVTASYALRFDGVIPPHYIVQVPWMAAAFIVTQIGLLVTFRLYNQLWAYASLPELFNIAVSTAVGSLGLWVLNVFYRPFVVPRSIFVIEWLLSTTVIGSIRILLRLRSNWMMRKRISGKDNVEKRLLIVGAGDAGALAAREIQHSTSWQIVGFIDDDQRKWGNQLYGLPVLGGRDCIPEVVRRYRVTEILIAMPSVSRRVVREIFELCQKTKVPVRTLPALYELINGRITVSTIREIRIEDLLGREPVQVDIESIAAYLRNKRVLVTGAGGTIGSEICRQVARFGPEQIIMIGRGEHSLVQSARDLSQQFPNIPLLHVVADIRDRDSLFMLFETFRPQIVFHAAAHKHVPEMEKNPREAVTNNVFGTLNVFEACEAVGVERCVFISSDKAANPAGVMGASKRIGELLVRVAAQGKLEELAIVHSILGSGWWSGKKLTPSVEHLSSSPCETMADPPMQAGHPIFVAVRFGNVLGSRGSVVEIFRKALLKGQDLEVTHPEMRRYFMTVQEAVALVIQAGGLGKGGEIFVLDMGEPVRVVDLARDMIRLAGLEPDIDVKIRFTNPRPGEKMTEEIVGEGEQLAPTEHPKILRIEGLEIEFRSFVLQFCRLAEALRHPTSQAELREILFDVARLPVRT